MVRFDVMQGGKAARAAIRGRGSEAITTFDAGRGTIQIARSHCRPEKNGTLLVLCLSGKNDSGRI